MANIENSVLNSIKSKPKGSIILPRDFISLGSSIAVRKALQRLYNSGFIKKLSQGIYYRPKINEYIGEITPSIEDVVKQIAKRDKVKIIPTGSYALYALGLTTQIPMNQVYITDGSTRKINIGNQTIIFKNTTAKNLLLKDEITILIVQALKELGKGNVSADEMQKIQNILLKEKPKNIEHDLTLVPEWIRQTIKKAYNESI